LRTDARSARRPPVEGGGHDAVVAGGRADVRNGLFMAALAALRELLTVLNAIIRDQRPWQSA